MVLHAVESVLSLLMVIAAGWFLAGTKWFSKGGQEIFSKFSIQIAIPCYMIYNIVTICDGRKALLKLFASLPVPFATMLVSFAIGLFLAKIFRVGTPRRGVFINAIAFSNTVIIGFPVVSSLLGTQAMPDAMVYYMANTFLFWTIGAFLLRLDGPQKARLFSLSNLRRIFSPPILGFLAGVLLVLFHVTLPDFIFTPIKMIKETTTAVAMIFIGSVVRTTDFRGARLTKDLIMVLAVRFIVSPVIMILLCQVLPITPMKKQVFFVLSTMPAMTQLGIVAKESGSDYHFSSVVVTLTTAVSMAALPIYMGIISHFHLFG